MDGSGALLAWPRVGADAALAVQSGAQAFVADVPFDDVGDGRVEDDVDEFGVVVQQGLDLVSVRRVADPDVSCFVSESAADAAEEVAVREEPVDVAGAEAFDRLGRAPVVMPHGERGVVLERAPEVWVDRMHAVAVAAELQFVDNELVEQADDIRTRADDPALVVERCLERARAADAVTSLENERLQSRVSEVRGRRQPVVPAPDNDNIPGFLGQMRSKSAPSKSGSMPWATMSACISSSLGRWVALWAAAASRVGCTRRASLDVLRKSCSLEST